MHPRHSRWECLRGSSSPAATADALLSRLAVMQWAGVWRGDLAPTELAAAAVQATTEAVAAAAAVALLWH
jgi:hypothetical protein